MIRVLLVDDEQFIREGLRQIVNWQEYGYEIAAEASNGMEAITILEEMQIDVMFADIRMPGMTGLELIEYVQDQLCRNIHFVILTGYADFEYARTAIRMRVKDYMLKPVQKQELITILQRLNEEHQVMQVKEKEQFWYHLAAIIHGKYTQEDMDAAAAELISADSYKYISMECPGLHESMTDTQSNVQTVTADGQQEIIAYVQTVLGEYAGHGIPIMETEEELCGAALILIPQMYQKTGQSETDFLEGLQRRISQHFSETFQFYAGNAVDGLDKLNQSFRSVRVSRCLYGLGEEKERVFEKETGGSRISFEIEETDVDALLAAVRANDRSQIERAAQKIFAGICSSDMNLEMLSASIYHILYRLMEMVREFDDETNQQEILEYIGKESFHHLVMMGKQEEITDFFADYAGYFAQVRDYANRNVIDYVDAYVREHYMEKISLRSLGEMFYINNVYLGQLYKKRYGIVFRDYLNGLRLEQAKRLLEETDLRIYRIAEDTGFGKPDYFINKFVQAYGITPNQYRMKLKKGEQIYEK